MAAYVIDNGRISQKTFETFLEMRRVFEDILRGKVGEEVSCHTICRAFAAHYPVEVRDGHFQCTGFHHSWLVFPENPHVVADMYPVGGAVPLLVSTRAPSPWKHLYMTDDVVTDVLGEVADLEQQVASLMCDIARFKP